MAWSNKDFISHFYTGNGGKIVLSQTGLSTSVKSIIDQQAIDRKGGLKDQIRDEAKKIGSGPIRYTANNSYDFGDVLYSFGRSVVTFLFEGSCSEADGKIRFSGTIKVNYIDDFTDVVRILDSIFGTSHPSGLPDWLKEIINLGGQSYPIVEEWTEDFSDEV